MSYSNPEFKNLAVAVPSRIMMYGISQALIDYSSSDVTESFRKGILLGTCYVASRVVTTFLGREIVYRHGFYPATDEEIKKLSDIKCIVHGSLWVLTVAMSWYLANLCGNSVDLKIFFIISGIAASSVITVNVLAKTVFDFKRRIPLCLSTYVDPHPKLQTSQ